MKKISSTRYKLDRKDIVALLKNAGHPVEEAAKVVYDDGTEEDIDCMASIKGKSGDSWIIVDWTETDDADGDEILFEIRSRLADRK